MSPKESNVDLLLINPGNRFKPYQTLGSTLAAIEPPVWAGLLAAFVRNHGFSVRILDANAENLNTEVTAQQAMEAEPALVTVVVYGHNPSASTQVMPAVREICSALKRKAPACKILLVGGHVAALPERTLREEEADFVCSGEGPYTILDLLRALSAFNPDFKKVRDIAYREGNHVQFTDPAPLVLDLDREMPGIAWDLLPMEKYRAHNWHCFGDLRRQPYASLYTTLGCPFRCSFCCIQAPFKRGEAALGSKKGTHRYRRWSAPSVLAQIDVLVREHGVKNIKFADEIFVLDSNHVLAICNGIIERGYDLNIWAYARVDSVKNGLLGVLKRAGVNWLALGIEAASERVRQDVAKKFAAGEVYKTVQAAHAAGIHIIGNYMFGLPDDTLETMQETLDLAMELKCEFANFYCTMAYPGSDLYRQALKEGWPLPRNWEGYSQFASNTLPLPTRHVTGAEVLRFRDHAFQRYFRNPGYLDVIERKFGPKTIHHIAEMVSQNINRNYPVEGEKDSRNMEHRNLPIT